jgi:serine/threonine protein kinase
MEKVTMPTIPEIKISIENKDLFVKDEFVRKGSFVRNANGSLIMYTGGFTAVFPFVANGEKWAFRCWHANIGNTAKRFQEIAKCVKSSQAQYLCDFAYADKGVLVDGIIYPATRMKWVEGQTIKDYICVNAYNKSKLLQLADSFLTLIKDMHNRSFAHGDLQHGNIIVDNMGSLFLVDYDSFYCPALKGERDIIKGLPDYQHPARNKNLYANEKLDYFSELIIYTSIIAIAENPNLATKYQVAKSERMSFSKNDYKHFTSSTIYKDLKSLCNDKISTLLEFIVLYLLRNDINELEPFDNLLGKQDTIQIQQSQYCTQCGTKYYKPYSRYCHICGKARK